MYTYVYICMYIYIYVCIYIYIFNLLIYLLFASSYVKHINHFKPPREREGDIQEKRMKLTNLRYLLGLQDWQLSYSSPWPPDEASAMEAPEAAGRTHLGPRAVGVFSEG